MSQNENEETGAATARHHRPNGDAIAAAEAAARPRTVADPGKAAPDTDAPADEKSGRPRPALPAAARRALAEAEARRQEHAARRNDAEREIGGRGGLDPARYGDWEIKGRAIDF